MHRSVSRNRQKRPNYKHLPHENKARSNPSTITDNVTASITTITRSSNIQPAGTFSRANSHSIGFKSTATSSSILTRKSLSHDTVQPSIPPSFFDEPQVSVMTDASRSYSTTQNGGDALGAATRRGDGATAYRSRIYTSRLSPQIPSASGLNNGASSDLGINMNRRDITYTATSHPHEIHQHDMLAASFHCSPQAKASQSQSGGRIDPIPRGQARFHGKSLLMELPLTNPQHSFLTSPSYAGQTFSYTSSAVQPPIASSTHSTHQQVLTHHIPVPPRRLSRRSRPRQTAPTQQQQSLHHPSFIQTDVPILTPLKPPQINLASAPPTTSLTRNQHGHQQGRATKTAKSVSIAPPADPRLSFSADDQQLQPSPSVDLQSQPASQKLRQEQVPVPAPPQTSIVPLQINNPPASSALTTPGCPVPNKNVSFYRRELHSSLIHFNSSRGRQLFKEAMLEDTMESYFPLSEQFVTQTEPSFCGLSTLTMSLNALGVDPQRQWKRPWRWFNDDLLPCCHPIDLIKRDGMTFEQFSALARCHGLKVEDHFATDVTLEQFREAVIDVCTHQSVVHDGFASSSFSDERGGLKKVMTISFSRKVLNQTGDGHISPVGGYHSGTDSVLVMDVARFKYPPYWVALPVLFESLKQVDKVSGKSRGYSILSVISPKQSAPSNTPGKISLTSVQPVLVQAAAASSLQDVVHPHHGNDATTCAGDAASCSAPSSSSPLSSKVPKRTGPAQRAAIDTKTVEDDITLDASTTDVAFIADNHPTSLHGHDSSSHEMISTISSLDAHLHNINSFQLQQQQQDHGQRVLELVLKRQKEHQQQLAEGCPAKILSWAQKPSSRRGSGAHGRQSNKTRNPTPSQSRKMSSLLLEATCGYSSSICTQL